MNNKFYITTTAPYVNGLPHMGHAAEFIKADVIARFKRLKLGEKNVWFNVGLDEHGLKIYQKAMEEGLSPEKYTDKFAEGWQKFCKDFLISNNTLYRTSKKYHEKPAQKFWKLALDSGDIYKKKYEGLYCVGCEEFKTEKDLVDGKCPDHGKEPVKYSEENYFFKLTKYKNELRKWLNENPDVLKPQKSYGEIIKFIEKTEDISISRKKENLPWGVPVPGDDSQVMYVWFDALTFYIGALGFGSENGVPPIDTINTQYQLEETTDYREWWPGLQVFGTDNLKFQAGIWQGMLASAKIPHTKKLLRFGWILASDGTKMSKTKGNVVNPFDQYEKFGIEAVRFYLITGLSTYSESPYKEEDLINIYNSHLANNYGNLLNRVIHLANKLEIEINNENKVENNFKLKVNELKTAAENLYEEYELQLASEKINELANVGNQYITEKQPWNKEMPKDEAQTVLNNLSYLLKIVSELYEPIIPISSLRAKEMLNKREAGVLFQKIEVNK